MTCRLLHSAFPLVVAACCLVLPSAASADDTGRAAYEQSCARCHGIEGRGDGWDAKRFYPRPRDLTSGTYKFRSTASGTPPTDDDILYTLEQGLHGSNMPDWQFLHEDTKQHIAAYLKTLAPVFQDAVPQPVETAPDPGAARANLAKGRVLYDQLGCAACHGAQGRGNGMSAAALVDDWGMPIRPANLTQGWTYRGGDRPRDIMLRVLTGVDGAGMPSYAGAVSLEDAWHLAYYVASLHEPPRWHRIARAAHITGALPISLDDARWEQAERTDVRMRNVVRPDGTWAEPLLASAVSVRVLYNEEALAWSVSWDDPSENIHDPADRLAVALKPADVRGDVVTLQAWPYEGAPSLALCAWSADAGESVETLASDFDAVRQPQVSAPLAHAARYEDGRWRVVLHRPLRPSHPEGAPVISLEDVLSMAFVVWDGSLLEARAVSTWIDVALAPRAGQAHPYEE